MHEIMNTALPLLVLKPECSGRVKINTMAADALAPPVARVSTAIASTIYDKWALVFR